MDKLNDLEKDFVIGDIKTALFLIHGSNEIMEERKKRIGQADLRKQVILRDKKCIISGHHHECCEVAHIKPFSNCSNDEKYDRDNAILLSSSLHKLFDKYYWSINPKTMKVAVSNKIKDNSFPIYPYKDQRVKLSDGQLKYMEIHFSDFKKNK